MGNNYFLAFFLEAERISILYVFLSSLSPAKYQLPPEASNVLLSIATPDREPVASSNDFLPLAGVRIRRISGQLVSCQSIYQLLLSVIQADTLAKQCRSLWFTLLPGVVRPIAFYGNYIVGRLISRCFLRFFVRRTPKGLLFLLPQTGKKRWSSYQPPG